MTRLNNVFLVRYRFFQQNLVMLVCICSLFFTSCSTLSPRATSTHSEETQKGQLLWPSDGDITEHFGTVVNPVYGTKTYNPGVWIATPASAEVISVSKGEVADIYTMPEFGRVVTINHGDFVSLYGNLSSLHVTVGVSVEAGEQIGISGTEDEPKGQSVFFAVIQNGVEENPELWLRSRNDTSSLQDSRKVEKPATMTWP